MNEEMVVIQEFYELEIANNFSEKLRESNIGFLVERIARPALDSNFIGTSSVPEYVVKVKSSDYRLANSILEDYYKEKADAFDDEHYLNDFTKQELLAIIEKPDEWSKFDYFIAQKILKQSGEELGEERITELRKKREEDVIASESDGTSLLSLGYIVILAGILYLLRIFNSGGIAWFPFFQMIAIICGHLLYSSQRITADGTKVFKYREYHRRQGKVIFFLAICITVLIIWGVLSYVD